MRYQRFPHNFFGDTLTTGTTSKRGKKYAEVFATTSGWTRAFPMKSKIEFYEKLSLMFQRDGVPPQTIVDVSKEQMEGDFAHKIKEAGCYLKQSELYYPWHNSAEDGIQYLKRGDGRNTLKARSKNRLWDDCVELDSYILSYTAHNIYSLNGDTYETIMSDDTSDISQFCELECYD